VKAFSSRTLIVVFSAGALTFLLGLLLAAFAEDIFDRKISAGPDTFSRSLMGHHGLDRFLDEMGITVVVNRNPHLYGGSSAFPILLLEPVAGLLEEPGIWPRDDEGILSGIVDCAERSGVPLIVALPKRTARPSASEPGWIKSEKFLPLDEVNDLLTSEELGLNISRSARNGGRSVAEGSLRVVDRTTDLDADELRLTSPTVDLGPAIQVLKEGPYLSPLVSCDEGILIGRFGRSNPDVYVISDPDLFNNRGLARGDHALIMHRFIKKYLGADGVVIDETLHGYRSTDSVFRKTFTFPLVLVTIHAVLVLAFFIWSEAPRFGRPSPPPPVLAPGKTLLIDNTSKLLRSTGDHRSALHGYLKRTVAVVARRYSIAEGTPHKETLRMLKNLTAARGLDFDVEKIADSVSDRKLSSAEALKLARKLHAWRRELIQGSS